MLHIAVCDDEKLFADRIREIVHGYLLNKSVAHTIDCFSSGEQFIELNEGMKKYDVVFMDINMENMDGIETAKVMRAICPDIFLVFVTAFINYTLDGYKVEAIRYVLKDYESMSDNIKEALDTIIDKMNIDVKSIKYDFVDGENKRVFLNDIMYVENSLHRISFHLMEEGTEKIYNLYKKLDEIEADFDSEDLVRTHQSFLVNMQYALNVRRYVVTLENGMEIAISKQRYKKTKESFIKKRGEI